MIEEEGHIGLSNQKVEEVTSENFVSALSFLKVRHTGYWIIHVYSKNFEYDSPYLQRSNADGRRWKKNFLERIGFNHFSSCNVLDGQCYYKVLDESPLGEQVSTIERLNTNTFVRDRFRKIASQFGDIYKKMRDLDQILVNAGFELPREKLELTPTNKIDESNQKIYSKGCLYDFYRDVVELLKVAKNEVIITDNWANEELINIYLDKIPENINIKVLTKKPDPNFVVVAKKFKSQRSVSFEVRTSSDWHDRWVFIDNECWVTGQSVKDAGAKPTYLVKLEGYDILKTCFDEVWKKANQLI